jgi:hypothetical protein
LTPSAGRCRRGSIQRPRAQRRPVLRPRRYGGPSHPAQPFRSLTPTPVPTRTTRASRSTRSPRGSTAQ